MKKRSRSNSGGNPSNKQQKQENSTQGKIFSNESDWQEAFLTVAAGKELGVSMKEILGEKASYSLEDVIQKAPHHVIHNPDGTKRQAFEVKRHLGEMVVEAMLPQQIGLEPIVKLEQSDALGILNCSLFRKSTDIHDYEPFIVTNLENWQNNETDLVISRNIDYLIKENKHNALNFNGRQKWQRELLVAEREALLATQEMEMHISDLNHNVDDSDASTEKELTSSDASPARRRSVVMTNLTKRASDTWSRFAEIFAAGIHFLKPNMTVKPEQYTPLEPLVTFESEYGWKEAMKKALEEDVKGVSLGQEPEYLVRILENPPHNIAQLKDYNDDSIYKNKISDAVKEQIEILVHLGLEKDSNFKEAKVLYNCGKLVDKDKQEIEKILHGTEFYGQLRQPSAMEVQPPNPPMFNSSIKKRAEVLEQQLRGKKPEQPSGPEPENPEPQNKP